MAEEITPSPLRAALPLFGVLRRFWAWWTGELMALVPKQWRGPPPLLLHLSANQTLVSGLDAPLRFDVPVAELSAQQAAQLQQAAQGRRVDVAITQPLLMLPVQLPLAAERSLASALRYQLMSASPAPVDDIVYDHRLRARDKAQGKLDVQVALITLVQLTALNDTLSRLKLVVQRIGAVEPGGGTLAYIFQRRSVVVTDDPARQARLWLGASALLLLMLLPLLHLGASSWAQRVETQSQDLHRTLKPKLAQRSAAQALAYQAPLLAQRLRTPAATAQLAAIMAAHSKDDWAEAISLTPKQLRLEVHTVDPQGLRTRLEAQPLLAGWRWRVLPSQDANTLTVLEANR
jgi:general secretion pathway protein L